MEDNRALAQAVAEQDEELDAGHMYVRFGDGQRVCPVELADNERGKGDEGSDEERDIGRTICIFIAVFCMIRPRYRSSDGI